MYNFIKSGDLSQCTPHKKFEVGSCRISLKISGQGKIRISNFGNGNPFRGIKNSTSQLQSSILRRMIG
jgi:hypothetical protein